jgi:hypothetical protein
VQCDGDIDLDPTTFASRIIGRPVLKAIDKTALCRGVHDADWNALTRLQSTAGQAGQGVARNAYLPSPALTSTQGRPVAEAVRAIEVTE